MRATDDVVKSLKDVKETFWTAGTNRYKNGMSPVILHKRKNDSKIIVSNI